VLAVDDFESFGMFRQQCPVIGRLSIYGSCAMRGKARKGWRGEEVQSYDFLILISSSNNRVEQTNHIEPFERTVSQAAIVKIVAVDIHGRPSKWLRAWRQFLLSDVKKPPN
jgi:hypothetical protein